MKTHRKLSLFILWVLVCGCPKEPPAEPMAPPPSETEETNSQGDLEADCYAGDPAACDELGH
jgi:hypothetical protein